MEFQGSPLLSNEISGYDINDEEKNESYTKEVQVLFQEISEDLKKLDSYNTGKVTENSLFNYLQSRLPPKRQLNVSLFQQLLQDVDREEGADGLEIDIEDFTKKYIKAQQQLKLNFDTLKKGFDKERSLRSELEQKIQNSKQEKLNKNGMSENSCVSTEIGKVSVLSQIDGEEVFCTVSLDNLNEKKTASKNINDNLSFTETFTFPIATKEKVLIYKLYTTSNPSETIGELEVPLFILNVENEEITPETGFKDINQQTIAIFKPKIIVVTSYYEMYQKQYDNIEKNIDSYQSRIAQLSETLAELSLPYKKEFDNCLERTLRNAEAMDGNNELINNIEGVLKGALGKKELSWYNIYKLVLYFCIFTQLFTSFTKPDFISLVTEIALAIIINTGMTNYLYNYYKIFFFGIIIGICYDLFDFLFINNISISSMSSVNATVKIFGFIGFLGKIALLICTEIIKKKYGKVNTSNNIQG
jgi:hypothetical protein